MAQLTHDGRLNGMLTAFDCERRIAPYFLKDQPNRREWYDGFDFAHGHIEALREKLIGEVRAAKAKAEVQSEGDDGDPPSYKPGHDSELAF